MCLYEYIINILYVVYLLVKNILLWLQKVEK